MLSILLVEDERLELETLRDYVDWDKLGIGKVYTARNGRSALECMAEHEADIMITDIQMPVMNGIELTRRVREEGYACKIIFLTGYDDFDYVKAAFAVDAVDYILKPFSVEEVEKLIGRVRAQILEERVAADTLKLAAGKLLEQACMMRMEPEQLDALCEIHFGRAASDKAFGLLAVYGRENSAYERAAASLAEVIHIFRNASFYIVVLGGYVHARDAAGRLLSISGQEYSAVWSGGKTSLTGLFDKVREMENCRNFLFYAGKGETVCLEETGGRACREADREKLHLYREQLKTAIASGNTGAAQTAVTACLQELSVYSGRKCRREAFGLYLNIYNHFVPEDAPLTEWLKQSGAEEPALMEAMFFSEVSELLSGYVHIICAYFGRQKEDPNYYVTAWVKDYISKNYSGPCAVEDMAGGLHLSPNYLRSLFKAGAGQTVLEYLTDYRLEKASLLLRDKKLKIRDISQMTGYENVSWFSQLFVKKYGVTPNEYRKMV